MPPEARVLGRPFWTFWGSSALANVGDGIRAAAFPLLAASLTDDAVAVAAVSAAQTIPWLMTGLLAGSLADRRSARTLIVTADLGRIGILAALVIAVALDRATISLVVMSAFALGVGETLRDTAAQVAIPRLVPKHLLERANGRMVAGDIVGNEFVGPPVGAMLFVAGAAIPFAVNGASLTLAVVLVLSLPLSVFSRSALGVPVPGVRPGVRAGLAWLMRHRMLRMLALVGAAVAAADSAWFAIFVLFSRDTLDVGAVGFGVLLAVGAGGGLLGSLAADRVVARSGARTVLTWSVAITAGSPLLLAVVPQVWAATAVIVVTSASFAVLNVTAVSLRQRAVPEDLLGRVIAAGRTLTFGCAALGALIGGALSSRVGVEAPFLFSGAIATVAPVAWWSASRRQAERIA